MMAIKRMDHVGIVVDDLATATAFFEALGMEVLGAGAVGGDWVGRIIGLRDVRARLAMLQTPDALHRVELVTFDSPANDPDPGVLASNVPGLRHLCFNVDDLDATLDRLREHGGELVGSIEQYENAYRLCYVHGPHGVIVELAEDVR